jgi:hypothetical protein
MESQSEKIRFTLNVAYFSPCIGDKLVFGNGQRNVRLWYIILEPGFPGLIK